MKVLKTNVMQLLKKVLNGLFIGLMVKDTYHFMYQL